MSRLLLGAVAYDPKVITIWNGFREYLREADLDFDYVLYSNYERQVEDLVAGRIDAAWNSPLAWVRAARLAASSGQDVRAIAMRDTDRDLRSLVLVRTDSSFRQIADLGSAVVAVGAIDSPQSTLLPLSLLRSAGVASPTVRRFDVGVGLHGDHVGGERSAAQAIIDGTADVACILDANLLLFSQEGTLPPDSVRVLAQTEPYDHCNMTATSRADPAAVERFTQLLFEMSYDDLRVRPLLDLEGLKQWMPGRLAGYRALEQAVDECGFYDADGQISAKDYRY